MTTNPLGGFWRKYNFAIKSIALILAKWIFFNVGIALIPLLFTYTILLGNGQDSYTGFLKYFSLKGELLVLSTALIGEGISELLTTSIVSGFVRIMLGGICTLALILACFLYANISTLSSTTQDYSFPSINSTTVDSVKKDRNDTISGLSQQLLLVSLFAGATCKIIAAIESKSNTSQNIGIQPSGGGQTGGTNP